jgi:YVTN family beta-propeller protein
MTKDLDQQELRAGDLMPAAPIVPVVTAKEVSPAQKIAVGSRRRSGQFGHAVLISITVAIVMVTITSCTVVLLKWSTATSIVVGDNPEAVAVVPDGRYAYVTNTGSGSVSVIDTNSNTVTNTITLDGNPFGVAVAPNGRYLYVTNPMGRSVSVIDTGSNTVSNTITSTAIPSEWQSRRTAATSTSPTSWHTRYR